MGEERERERESVVVCVDAPLSEHIKIGQYCNGDISIYLYLKTGRRQRRRSRRKNYPTTEISYPSLFFVTSVYTPYIIWQKLLSIPVRVPLYGQDYLPFNHGFRSNRSFHHLSSTVNVAVSQRFLRPSDITGQSQEPRNRSAESRWPARFVVVSEMASPSSRHEQNIRRLKSERL